MSVCLIRVHILLIPCGCGCCICSYVSQFWTIILLLYELYVSPVWTIILMLLPFAIRFLHEICGENYSCLKY
uniref:Uncharacterized protein n=1 Tax=Rhizophora mucronata TaxID=61149 RepID=A0A2P2QTM1_RHIMU